MPAQYVPRSTTLSDVLATHSRQLAHLMREVQSIWTVIRLIEAQQADERHQWRRDAAAESAEPAILFLYEEDLFGTPGPNL